MEDEQFSTVEPCIVATGTFLDNGAEVLRVGRRDPVHANTAACVAYWPGEDRAHDYVVWDLNDADKSSMYNGRYCKTDYEAQAFWAERLGLT